MNTSVLAIAEELVRSGDAAQAETVLRQAAAVGPLPAEGAAMLARLLHNRAVAEAASGADAAAEQALRQALEYDPQLAASRQALAALLLPRCAAALADGHLELAAATAEQAAALGVPAPLPVGRAELAARLHQASVAAAPTDAVLSARLALAAWGLHPDGDGHYPTARSLFVHLGTGELGPAVPAARFEALLRDAPADPVALIGLANVERRAGRLMRAERLLRVAHAARPQPFAAGRLAALLAELGRHAEADRLFQAIGAAHGGVESVIRLDPGFMAALAATPPEPAPAVQVPADAEFVAFAGCDSVYFRRFSDAFVNSLALTGAKLAVHFHIVDMDEAARDHLQHLGRRHPGLLIQATGEASPRGIAAADRRTFYACARFLRLPGLLRAYGRPVLMLDIDLVVLRDVGPLLAQLQSEQADIALTHGAPHDPWCRLWADAILCAASPAAIAAFEAVRAYLLHFLGRGAAVWFLDQAALYAALAGRFRPEPAPRLLPWPMDVQNGDGASCYFWSLHSSQPSNQGSEDSALYRRFALGAGP